MIGGISTSPATPAPEAKRAELKQAAKAFEAIFLRQMISSMRAGSLGEGMFDSSATNQFRDMQDSRVADDMAGKGALGIADLLLAQFGGAAPAKATPAPAVELNK